MLVHLAREAEIDDLRDAVVVHEDVGGLEVAMDKIATLRERGLRENYLHVEKAAEQLVQKRFHVAFTPARNTVVVLQDP